VADVGKGVLGFDPLAELGAPGGSLLALAQIGQQHLVWMDGNAAPVAAGGAAGRPRPHRPQGLTPISTQAIRRS